jgi:peptide methionine sulfoxide reductase MsrA
MIDDVFIGFFVIEEIPGVVEVTVGYAGGNYDNPDYHQVLANKDNTNYLTLTFLVF